MESKKIIGLILTLGGGGALTYGIISILSGGQLTDGTAWAFTILGIIFFSAGIGLMKSVKPAAEE